MKTHTIWQGKYGIFEVRIQRNSKKECSVESYDSIFNCWRREDNSEIALKVLRGAYLLTHDKLREVSSMGTDFLHSSELEKL